MRARLHLRSNCARNAVLTEKGREVYNAWENDCFAVYLGHSKTVLSPGYSPRPHCNPYLLSIFVLSLSTET